MVSDITFWAKTCKVKVFVFKNAENVFSTDWMELFGLWDLPINLFYRNINDYSFSNNKVSNKLKYAFLEVMLDKLGLYVLKLVKMQYQCSNQKE